MFLCLVYQGQQLTAGGRLLQPRAGEMVEGQNGLLHQQLHAGDGDETPGPGRLIQLRFPGGVDQVKHRRAGGKAAQEGQIRKKSHKGEPTAIIAHTIKGKGVSFMEDKAGWHGKAPNEEEYKIAMEELEKEAAAL